MKLLEVLRLNKWYGVVLYLGVLMMAGSLFSSADFIEPNHLLGMGIGLVMIGISYWMAEKYRHEFKLGGMFTTLVIIHNFATIIILIFGIIMTGFFEFLIVRCLISR